MSAPSVQPLSTHSLDVRVGDCRELLREMPDESVQRCVTSPPYFGDKILQKLGDFDSLLAEAPDDPSPEQLAEDESQRAALMLEERQARALSQEAGWPPKALHDVQNVPLQGEKWHRAFDDALAAVMRGGIVILYGVRGSGKTRMAAEIAVRNFQGTYRTAMGFFTDVRASFKPKSTTDERDIIAELVAPWLLVLDEMQVRGGTKFEDNLLTHLIDARYAAMKPTILIANLTADQLAESLGASIVDRVVENGISIDCDWPSFRANPENAQGDGSPDTNTQPTR